MTLNVAAPTKTAEELQAELDAVTAKYAKLVADIPRVAGTLARRNNLCSVVNSAIDTLGLPVPNDGGPEAVDFEVTVTFRGKYHKDRASRDWTSVDFRADTFEETLKNLEDGGAPQLTAINDYRSPINPNITANARRDNFGLLFHIQGYSINSLEHEITQTVTPSTKTPRKAAAKKAAAKKAARKTAAPR